MIKTNGERLCDSLLSLCRFGGEEGEGITRLAYSEPFWEACRFVRDSMLEAGLSARIDDAGNVIGTLPGKTGRKIVVGSHIDTVPHGGMFDGCLGVMAGIECMHTLLEAGETLDHTVEIVAFAEEEGIAVGGLLGSKAYSGLPLGDDIIRKLPSVNLERAAVEACRCEGEIDYSLELHIEQGGILEQERKQIGVVQAIVGIRRYEISIPGTANHAGSTPMYLRDDALVKAARLVQWVDGAVRVTDPAMVGTVGVLTVYPSSTNIIPGRVDLILELRAAKEDSLDAVYQKLVEEFPEFAVRQVFGQPPVGMDPAVRGAVRAAGDALGLSHMDMNSGAGHDSMILAQITRTGMIFVPSKNGVSHSPDEWTEWADAANGADVLLHALLALDKAEAPRDSGKER